MYADLIVDISAGALDRVFQYKIPDEMLGCIEVGSRVMIPFGRSNREVWGYVVGLSSKPSYEPDKIKPLISQSSDLLAIEGQMIRLAAKIREIYGGTMLQALKTVIPVKQEVRGLEKKCYTLGVDKNAAEEKLLQLKQDKRSKAKVRLLEYLLENGEVSKEVLNNRLQISAPTLKRLLEDGTVAESVSAYYRKPVAPFEGFTENVRLNQAQQAAADAIMESKKDVHLLFGITGSGKTEVYIHLLERTLLEGRQAIVLIPEIALTLQTVSRFYAHFGDRVSVMNSRLSKGERYDQYLRAKRGDVDIIVGPRSALFMPFEKLGLIIIDEEHDGAYKSETVPKYHAREAAIWRAHMCKAKVVLGSATPSVVSYDKARRGIYELHTLPKRAKEESAPAEVTVVDLRREFQMKNKKLFSRALYTKLEACLNRGEQAMLFLNRRGYAGFVSCRSCGYVLKCKHCDVSLTAHYGGRLKCHYCGYEAEPVKVCPECGSPYIAAFGTGTQKVETMVKEAFPNARVLRLDKDTSAKKDSADKILSDFRAHKADILVGTQMIVKGHDFPKVTLVGVLAADLSMFSGDYMSAERTFQLLVQAAGRAGRDRFFGHVVIQTYNPEHYSIVTAAKQDYEAFYREEIVYRRLMHYPPDTHVLAVLAEAEDERQLEAAVRTVADFARQRQSELSKTDAPYFEVIGPADAFVSKGKDAYRKVLYLKCTNLPELSGFKNDIEKMSSGSDGFKKVYIQFDMDPMTMY